MHQRHFLFVAGLLWFAIAGAEWFLRGLPQMTQEWRSFSRIEDNLEMRDTILTGWADAVLAVRSRVPAESELAFLSDVGESRYSYLSYLLNYEIYPVRHRSREEFRQGLRPRFLLVYPRSGSEQAAPEYGEIYRGQGALLLEKRP